MARATEISRDYLQVLTHFYRGEVQRSTDWRTRLDTTTNWAIVASAATFSWCFGSLEDGAKNHIIFFFTSLLCFLLLCIEARRYRHFDVWRTRVRMLEVHLLVPALNPELDILQGDWREVLSNDLLRPSYKISFWEALARRLLANYVWVFLALLVGWMTRVYTSMPVVPGEGITWARLYEACGYGIITPLEILSAYGAFWVFLVAVVAGTWKHRHVTGEIRRKDPRARKWPI